LWAFVLDWQPRLLFADDVDGTMVEAAKALSPALTAGSSISGKSDGTIPRHRVDHKKLPLTRIMRWTYYRSGQ
jgi:hypothetical protein